MRIEIEKKMIFGFVIVIGSVVIVPYLFEWLGTQGVLKQLGSVFSAILIGFLIGMFASKGLVKNFRSLIESAGLVSAGDLKTPIYVPHRLLQDESDELAEALIRMIAELKNLVRQIRAFSGEVLESAQSLSATSEEVSVSSREISNSARNVAQGADNQFEQVENIFMNVRELLSAVETISIQAVETSQTAEDAARSAETGSGDTERAINKMHEIFDSFEELESMVKNFMTSIGEIDRMLEVITRVAQQTNILAVNATIEAARAGEAGRGFAVVADEVRKLADSSEASAGHIYKSVDRIREDGNKVLDKIERAAGESGKARIDLNNIRMSLNGIVGSVHEVLKKVSNISGLTGDQRNRARTVTEAVERVFRVARDNTNAVGGISAATQQQHVAMEHLAESAQKLTHLAEVLNSNVNHFQVD